jgi:mRNA interferase MazF
LVLSKNTYNSATNLIIVCPITTSDKERPFLVPIQNEKLKASNNKISKVNTLQVFSLDYTETANLNVKYVDTLDEEIFFDVAQRFLKNFSFPI